MAHIKPPTFFVIGAAKSGTTSLHYYLSQHPRIYVPTKIKESNYFVYSNREFDTEGPGERDKLFYYLYGSTITTLKEYEDLYLDSKDEQIKGEVCPRYMYYENAAPNIKAYTPDAKVIAIVRNPADRAFSHYKMLLQNGLATHDFMRELELEDNRCKKGWAWDWHYTRLGMYYHQLKRVEKHFPREKIKVLLYDDLVKNPSSMMGELFEFLEVENVTISFSERHKVSYVPNNEMLHKMSDPNTTFFGKSLLKAMLPRSIKDMARSLVRSANQKSLSLRDDEKKFIQDRVRHDVHSLEEYIGRDLSHWLA
jgi:hypothetical protein